MSDNGQVNIELGNIELSGWQGVVALVGLAVVALFVGIPGTVQKLDHDGRAKIEQYLIGSYGSEELADLRSALDEDEIDEDLVSDLAQDVRSSTEIEVVSAEVIRRDDEYIARAEIRVGGEIPKDGKTPRYFRMEKSVLTGWRVNSETGSYRFKKKYFLF